jgi:hypothetical protein
VTSLLDSAQRALLAAVPTSRDQGVPLDEALSTFLSGLAETDEAMQAWRAPATEPLWERCREALAQARAAAERLAGDATRTTVGFEALNARLGDVLSPLEEFADVAASLR